MGPQEAREVEHLLTYEEDSAGGMMTPAFARVSPELTAEQAFAEVRKQARDIEHIDDVYVLGPADLLVGFVTLREVLLAEPGQPLRELFAEHPATLTPSDPARRVAELAAKYNLSSLPVLDEGGRVLGVVTIDDVLERVLHG
jgi:magnesium transporter